MARNLLVVCRVSFLLVAVFATLALRAGIDKRLQNHYLERYLNKTIFLRVPIYGLRQSVDARESGSRLDTASQGEALVFKVGEQVRVTRLEFKDRSIRFRLSALDASRQAAVFFQFAQPLQEYFAQQGAFEDSLLFAFTEGVSYQEIDSAKAAFIESQYEELIRTFAATTGTSREFVVHKIAEQNPEYKKAIKEAAQLATKASSLETKLAAAAQKLAAEESRSANLRQQLEEVTVEVDEEKEERLRILDQRDEARAEIRKLQAEIDQIKRSQATYEKQVKDLMTSLDAEPGDSNAPDSNVGSLGVFVSKLQTARSTLSTQLAEVQGQVAALQSEAEELRKNLVSAERNNRRLSSRLRALTSDKKSINAQYLQMREQKEILETADALSKALRVEVPADPESDEGWLENRFYLDSKLLGTVRIAPPEQVGAPARVEMSLLSPDTVTFSERERELHFALGDDVRAEVGWVTPEGLVMELAGEDHRRVVKVRESTFWEWNVGGELTRSQPATLKIDLIDRNDQRIPLHTRQFVVHSAGLGSRLFRILSLPSLLAGLILGAAAIGTLAFLRRPQRRKAGSRHPVEYLTEKEL